MELRYLCSENLHFAEHILIEPPLTTILLAFSVLKPIKLPKAILLRKKNLFCNLN